MQVGWDRGVRVRGNLIYVTLQNDKIFVEYDGIERGIIEELIKRGVAKDKIVLPSLLPLNEKPVTVSVDNQNN
jgi:XisI protein